MRAICRRRWIRLLVPLVVAALSGCFNSAVFLDRGYGPGDLVQEEHLVGRWGREPKAEEGAAGEVAKLKAALVIERPDSTDPCYRVTFLPQFVKDWEMMAPDTPAKVCVFKASGQVFFDITRWPEGIDFEHMTVSWHWFAAADISSDELRLKLLHPILVGTYVEEHPLDLPHVDINGGEKGQTLITASTQDIQLFLLLHVGLGDLMDEEYVLAKLRPEDEADQADDADEESDSDTAADTRPNP
jgi:hypothetical protein